jgi:hypothetical protein
MIIILDWLKGESILFKFIVALVLVNVLAVPYSTVMATEKEKWQLQKTLHLPNWISLSGEHRVRYETLDNQFRSGSTGSDQVLSLRTLVQTELYFNKNFFVKLELQDSRAELADTGSRMNTTIVNAAELMEANLVWKTEDLFSAGSKSVLRGGRLTMDIGKRRIIARNRFRNVIQGYTGLDWKWTSNEGTQIRTIFTMPVNREPSTTAELLDNDASFDNETLNRILWGTYFSSSKLPWGDKGEIYVFGFHEKDDEADFRTRNRQLYTPGFRLYRPWKKGQFDYELESMFQFGTVRATTAASDTKDLDHFAYFHHAEVGYTFSASWSPRVYLEYDYASGDSDPNDGTNERFERLLAPNVPEFGPTSIHTAFARANINSPGLRVQIRPNAKLFAYLSYRAYWLASKNDGWQGASGLRDTSGNSGRFLGQQLFLRAKWKWHPNMKFEGGIAYRIDGDFQRNVSNSPRQGNSVYSYASATLSF